ncbi:hypothetical protein ANCDUO_01230 [Ancylostoma duodenale]|uniref:Uncharacterized protein n=1 Tax=Ancylostoma duodenale TaxID=51022 RepID=A0A0C2DZH1_9BILA|nr:hypothetical protein ANCDUO_01230 [Ancylostoma duodenale]
MNLLASIFFTDCVRRVWAGRTVGRQLDLGEPACHVILCTPTARTVIVVHPNRLFASCGCRHTLISGLLYSRITRTHSTPSPLPLVDCVRRHRNQSL